MQLLTVLRLVTRFESGNGWNIEKLLADQKNSALALGKEIQGSARGIFCILFAALSYS